MNIIKAKDWSNINQEEIISKPKTTTLRSNSFVNLGIYKDTKGNYRSKGYVGITRLRDEENNVILDKDNKECVLQVEPRFSWIEPIKMLNELRDDDEFINYLIEDLKKGNKKENVGDLEDEVIDVQENKLFYFYEDELPIEVECNYLKDTNIVFTMLFINLLTEICKRNLMGKMQKYEENLTGKVKGKILFNKNIKHNISRGRKDRIYCQYQVYTVDILENQILKYGLYKAKKIVNEFFDKSEGSISRKIAYCDKALENVSFRKIPLQEIKATKVSGFYANYKPALKYAKMLIDGVAINVDGNIEKKEHSYVAPYAINMQKLFEFYVRKIIKDEIKNKVYKIKNGKEVELKLEKYNKKHCILEVNEGKEGYPKYKNDYTYTHLQGNVKPDIILEVYEYIEDKKNVYEYIVLDAKYKRHEVESRDDTLQILAYGMLYNSNNIGLVFPGECEKNTKDNGENAKSLEKKSSYKLNINSCKNEKYYHEIIINNEESNIINPITNLL